MVLLIFGLFSGLPVAYLLGRDTYANLILISWAIFFAILQFLIFKCPYCGKLAIFSGKWTTTPFVGNNCRYCGKEY
jgi:uncharacterized protein (DUF983 family)